VKLEILDLRGRVVRTLVNTSQAAGMRHEATWDGTSNAGRKLPSGSYISQLTVGGAEPQARILTLVK
jgi:flagellar hook assembly protein FlgD